MSNSEKDIDLKGLIDGLKPELSDYIQKRLKLFKLDMFEKGGIAISILGYGLIILILVSSILFFFLFGLAFFLGEYFDSNSIGFGILLAICTLILVVIMLCRKKIQRYILLRTISILKRIDDNKDE